MLQNQRHFLFSASATVVKNAISQSLFAVMKNKLSFYSTFCCPLQSLSHFFDPFTLFHFTICQIIGPFHLSFINYLKATVSRDFYPYYFAQNPTPGPFMNEQHFSFSKRNLIAKFEIRMPTKSTHNQQQREFCSVQT